MVRLFCVTKILTQYMKNLFSYIKKNLVKYLVYFFVLIIVYGLIEYIFFAKFVEDLTVIEKVQIESTIDKKLDKKLKRTTNQLKKRHDLQDDEMSKTKRTIIELEGDIQNMKDQAEKSKEEGEKAKEQLKEAMPSME
mgnify:CR=1 FL=1